MCKLQDCLYIGFNYHCGTHKDIVQLNYHRSSSFLRLNDVRELDANFVVIYLKGRVITLESWNFGEYSPFGEYYIPERFTTSMKIRL